MLYSISINRFYAKKLVLVMPVSSSQEEPKVCPRLVLLWVFPFDKEPGVKCAEKLGVRLTFDVKDGALPKCQNGAAVVFFVILDDPLLPGLTLVGRIGAGVQVVGVDVERDQPGQCFNSSNRESW